MNKKLKEKLIKKNEELRVAFPNLYDQRWVEKAADEGFSDVVKSLKEIDPRLGEYAEKKDDYNVFAILYYSAFESALNTFFMQCLDDSITSIELCINELQKVSAEIRTKKV